MNPVADLLLAYLQKAEARNAELREQNRLLRIKVCQLRESREKWRARSNEKQRVIVRLRSNVYTARLYREMWKHRALTLSGSKPLVREERVARQRAELRTRAYAEVMVTLAHRLASAEGRKPDAEIRSAQKEVTERLKQYDTGWMEL